jgi:putative phosphoribosyl transferase
MATSPRQRYADRAEAGRKLASLLTHLREQQPVVLALPRGGVPVAFEIARSLEAPLDLLMVRKLRAPGYPELGIGAVVDGESPQPVFNDDVMDMVHPSPGYVEDEIREQLQLIAERKRLYRGDRPQPRLQGRCVVLVDDGIATGGTVRAALSALSASGARQVVLAVPVAPQTSLDALAPLADELVCPLALSDFHSVGWYFGDFEQTSDDEVVRLLNEAQHWSTPGGGR